MATLTLILIVGSPLLVVFFGVLLNDLLKNKIR